MRFIGEILVFLTILVTVPFVFGCSGSPTSTQAPLINSGKSKASIMTRYEFSLAVVGKTMDQVIAAVGRPEKTSESEGRTIWDYSNRTSHPVTGEIDPLAQVIFKDGLVTDALF